MHKLLPAPAALAAVFALSSAALAAEPDDTIATDRPDFIETSKTVGHGRLQIETSIARERNSDAGVKTTTFSTPTLLRYGISPSLELRLESDGYMRERTLDTTAFTDNVARGAADLSMGAKWAMQEGEGATPSIAWLFHADLPSGSGAFKGEGVRPSVRTVLEWELPLDFSVGVMPGLVYDKAAGDRFVSGIFAVVVGRQWTARFRTLAEVAGRRLTSSRHGGPVVTYDLGAAYLVTKNVQVDTMFSWGANRYSPDFAWTTGLSMKF